MGDLLGLLTLAGNTASPSLAMLALVAGTACGLAAGLMPGVSGRAGLVLVTPIAVGLGPIAGAMFLVAFHSVVHTSGSVPAILLGAPTSAAEAATVIDGYAMTRKGEAARAVGASLAASAIGGVIGAVILLTLAPAALGIARYIGGPELAGLAALGLLSISALSGGGLAGGLMTACMGMIVASIGVTSYSGTERFTLGLPELSDGINVATIVTGLFVVPELVAAHWERMPAESQRLGRHPVLRGFVETLGHRWLLLRTSLLSAIIGMMPGMGAGVAVWIAYGHARQTEPSPVPYGEGAIAGVIAPEAANNAKEGGALAPTLFFGIPSSSGMGILMAAFILIGVEVGPRLLTADPQFIYLMGATNIVANILAVPLCLLVLPAMIRLAAIRGEAVAPVALAAGIVATWLTEPLGITLVMIAIFSLVGLLLKSAGLPRAPLLLGFVLAPSIESGVVRSSMIHGLDSFTRPGLLLIIAVALAVVLPPMFRRKAAADRAPPKPPSAMLAVAVFLAAATMMLGMFGTADAPPLARLLPGMAASLGLVATIAAAWPLVARRPWHWPVDDRPDAVLLAMLGLFLTALAFVMTPIAAALFVFAALLLRARVGWFRAAITALGIGGAASLIERIAL